MPPSRRAKSKAKRLPAKQMSSIRSERHWSSRGERISAKKSPYFEHPPNDEDAEDRDENESVFEYDSAVSLPDSGDNMFETDDVKSKKRPRSSTNTTTSSGAKKLKKPGEVFIPIIQPNPGRVEYQAHKIHPNTLGFLKALSKNNDRAWFAENDGLYKSAKSDFESFVESTSKAIIEKVDDTVPELPLKDLIFRIHRDIRFSNDRTPYKTHFSVAWSRTGKKGPYACYFLSLQPGNSFVGGGLWHTNAPSLSLLRRNIDKNPHQIKGILTNEELTREFFGARVSGDERKAVEAFVERNKEDALKTAPKTYPKDHQDIELLRLRSYTLGKRLADEVIIGDDAVQIITSTFKKMEPFIKYLNSVVMPDIADSSDAASGEEDGNVN